MRKEKRHWNQYSTLKITAIIFLLSVVLGISIILLGLSDKFLDVVIQVLVAPLGIISAIGILIYLVAIFLF